MVIYTSFALLVKVSGTFYALAVKESDIFYFR
jgi:hypothetical protein